jgi:6-phosphofructo-2-kinase / fructose-2,6-biphosphatase 2
LLYTVVHTDTTIRQDPEAAAKDFRDRIRNYEKVYQTIDESEKQYSYVKIVDLG